MRRRRVVVGLAHAPRRGAVLEAAAELAARMEAELVGLFVESPDLLHFAGMPFAREVGRASATRRELDVQSMERSLRALAKEAERMLAAAAGRTTVQWSFRVTRGPLAAELLAAAEDADLVIAGVEEPDTLPESVSVRVVRAGELEALLEALAAGGGRVLLFTGADDSLLREALRRLAGTEET